MLTYKQVQLSTGLIEGVVEPDLMQFRGVPYAQPPVAELRFAPPRPVKPWSGVLDATRNGPIAPQDVSRVFVIMGAICEPQGEDCLTVHIWVPQQLPVL